MVIPSISVASVKIRGGARNTRKVGLPGAAENSRI